MVAVLALLASTTDPVGSLLEAAKRRPTAVVFALGRCPMMAEAAPFYAQLHRRLGGRAQIVVVVQGDAAERRRLAAQLRGVRLIRDDAGVAMSRFGAARSPTAVALDAKGNPTLRQDGWCAPDLRALAAHLAHRAGTRPPTLDLKNAYPDRRYG